MADSRSENKMEKKAMRTARENTGSQPDGVFENQPQGPGTIGRIAGRILGAIARMAGKGHRKAASFIVIAASLALTGPTIAQAQAPAPVQVWSGTLNVKDLGSSRVGCRNSASSGKRCNESSVLSDDDFTLRSGDREIVEISASSTSLKVTISGSSGTPPYLKVTLHVGSGSLDFADATRNNPISGGNDEFTWTMTNLNWSDGESIALRLTEVQAVLLESASVVRQGFAITLIYDEALNESSSRRPPITAFSARANGKDLEILSFGIDRSQVRLTIASTIASDEKVTVSYQDPTSEDDANAIQGTNTGHDAPSFTNVKAVNGSNRHRPEFIPAVNDRYDCIMRESPDRGSAVCNSFHPDSAGSTTGVHASAWAYSATDRNGDTLTYSLGGPDADDFNINSATGNVTTKKEASRYNGNSNGGKTVFRVTLEATDGEGLTGTQAAIVTFEDAFEITSLNVNTWIRNGYVVNPRANVRWDNPWSGGHSTKLKDFEIQYYDTTSPDNYNRESGIGKSKRYFELKYSLQFDKEYMVRVVATGESRGGLHNVHTDSLDETPWRRFSTGPMPEASGAPGDPLTVAFINAPASHDGSTAFMMQLEFNATLTTGWEALRDSITVTNQGEILFGARMST